MSSQKKIQLIWSCFSSPNCRLRLENPLDKAKKKIFKVWVVDTLNFCLKVPKKIEKTRNQSDQPRLKKCQKTVKNRPNSNVAYF